MTSLGEFGRNGQRRIHVAPGPTPRHEYVDRLLALVAIFIMHAVTRSESLQTRPGSRPARIRRTKQTAK